MINTQIKYAHSLCTTFDFISGGSIEEKQEGGKKLLLFREIMVLQETCERRGGSAGQTIAGIKFLT